jgi:hypothetical protein
MPNHVVFAAPFFLETTLRFVAGAARLPGVNLSLISQDPVQRLPADLRQKLAGHRQVDDALDPAQLVKAAKALAHKLGPPVRMLGALEQLQLPLAQARDALGIEGLDAASARNFRDKAQMKEVLKQAGVPCARHLLVENPAQASAFAGLVASLWPNHPPGPAEHFPPVTMSCTLLQRCHPAQGSPCCWRSSLPAPSIPSTA